MREYERERERFWILRGGNPSVFFTGGG